MAPIVESIEIARSPEDVFAYVDDFSRHHEWQESIVSTKVETEGPTRVGTRVTDTRRVPGGPRPVTFEVTEHEPPRKASFRGVNGPVRPVGTITVEPSGGGSRITFQMQLVGHGIGKLMAPFAMMQARKQVPKDQQRLKQRLESGA
jgi:uncharacterized protein YndB with AHSA1/START domain